MFRILVKLGDLNDNRPQFYEPIEAKLSSSSPNDKPGFNRTLTWSQLTNSSSAEPLLVLRANDLDTGANGRVEYVMIGAQLVDFILQLEHDTGRMYLNSRLASNQTLLQVIWQSYVVSGLELKFDVVARDFGEDRLETRLSMRMNVLFDTTSVRVVFRQSFYYFQIKESIQTGFVFGYVDSIGNNAGNLSQVVYQIIDGDLYRQFEINYNTGMFCIKKH